MFKDVFLKMDKEDAYEMYVKLVYENKKYALISQEEMYQAILKEFDQKEYLYYLCTEREMECLKLIHDKKLTKKLKKEKELELKNLNAKAIVSYKGEIYKEQEENVRNALKLYNEHININEKAVALIVGFVRTHCEILFQALASIFTKLFKMSDKELNDFLGHPMIHYYCGSYMYYMESMKKDLEMVFYRDYFGYLDKYDELLKLYDVNAGVNFDLQEYNDIFYYGYNIGNPKVKKMYDLVKQDHYNELFFDFIEEARVLNKRDDINKIFDGELLSIVNEGLDNMPCAVMHGLKPKDYQNEKAKAKALDFKLNRIPQHMAHISKNAADEYYKYYLGILDFVNQKYHVDEKLQVIYQQQGINPQLLLPVDEFFWKKKNQYIKEFIEENPYNFNDEEIKIIEDFKKSLQSDMLVVMGYLRDYTEILNPKDGKVYMVKGVRDNLDKILKNMSLPCYLRTTLLMFKGNIIYCSLINVIDVEFDNKFNEQIYEQYAKGKRYYNL